jgi:hypothetical protein
VTWKPELPPPTISTRPGPNLLRPAVARSVQLRDVRSHAGGDIRHVRHRERPGRDDHPARGEVFAAGHRHAEAPFGPDEPCDAGVEADRKCESFDISGQDS